MGKQRLGTAREPIIVYAALLAVVAGFTVWCAVGSSALASGSDTAKTQLTIRSKECVIDVVQDGNGQNLQVPAEGCDVILPNLLTPVFGQDPAQLPFAGEDAAVPVVVRQIPASERREEASTSTPTPVAVVSNQVSATQSAGTVSVIVAGIGVVAAATAVGVDAALFELSHSKTAARWAKDRVVRRLPRKRLSG